MDLLTVDAGGFTSLTIQSGLMGRPDFHNIVYSAPQLLDGVEVAKPFLTAIILTDDEFQVYRQYGIVRVTTLLGKEYRFFPCAPWADRKRRTVVTPKEMENSILSNVGTTTIPEAVVYLAGQAVTIEQSGTTVGLAEGRLWSTDQRVTLELPVRARQTVERLLKELPEDAGMAILSNPDPLADALFCWSPGSLEPQAICPEGSRGQRTGGNFLLLLPDQPEDVVTIYEDGFWVRATRTTWRSIRKSLAAGTNLQVLGDDEGFGFEIVWIKGSANGES
jgi:hypothetical protein